METKKFTQFGTFTVGVLGAVELLIGERLFESLKSQGPETAALLSVLSVLLICLLLFYNLKIIVDQTYVTFKMGIGVIRKSYKISDLKSCVPVKNSIFSGIGIRLIRNGWLYNVSGLKAIELRFRNKDSVIRIGTNQPEEISALIQGMIGEKFTEDTGSNQRRKKNNPQLIFGAVILLIVIGMTISFNLETKVKVDKGELSISGIYGLTIPLNEINQIDTVSSFSRISMRTNGSAFGNTLTGNFRLADKRQVKLFIKAGHPPYILISSKNRVPIYLNFEDKQRTINLYKELQEKRR